MNKYIKIFSLLMLICSSINTIKASHKMGATMHYSYLGNSKYSIVVKFYRDCRGIPLVSPGLRVSIGSGGNATCGSYLLSSTRLSISDVTQICSDSTSPCNPANTTFSGYGYEEHVFESIIDITQAPFNQINATSCPEATFSFEICCRNNSITTGPAAENFYFSSTINFYAISQLAKPYNSSPKFNNKPIIFACCNQSLFISPGVTDSVDGDSFGFKLVPAQVSSTGSVTYTSPFSFSIPVTPFCIPTTSLTCSPNINVSPVRGFYFNQNTGLTAFTPTNCNEVSIIAMEILEYRKDANGVMQHLGTTRKDMQIIVRNDCGFNNAPTINSGSFIYQGCEEDNLSFSYSVNDLPVQPQQTKSDTTLLSFNSDIDVVENVTVLSRSNKSVQCLVNTAAGTARPTPYIYTITVSDDHCPVPAVQSRLILIYITKCNNAMANKIPAFNAELFPNPASNKLQLNFTGPAVEINIYNPSGQIVSHIPSYNSGQHINTQSFVPGVYMVQIMQNGLWVNKKLVIE